LSEYRLLKGFNGKCRPSCWERFKARKASFALATIALSTRRTSRASRAHGDWETASEGPFDLSVVTSEHSGAFHSGAREFRFQLKQPLPEPRFNDLWRRLNLSKQLEFVRTSSKTEEQHHE
jgi:hypothetical protein